MFELFKASWPQNIVEQGYASAAAHLVLQICIKILMPTSVMLSTCTVPAFAAHVYTLQM